MPAPIACSRSARNGSGPGRDDKVLADWNGLMIAALAKASAVFDQPAWLQRAENAFAFIVTHMGQDGRLAHSWRAGRTLELAFLEDYALMAAAAIALFEHTGQRRPIAITPKAGCGSSTRTTSIRTMAAISRPRPRPPTCWCAPRTPRTGRCRAATGCWSRSWPSCSTSPARRPTAQQAERQIVAFSGEVAATRWATRPC